MNGILFAMAIVSTLAAAARSTWSPCGWSMLSTLTPLGEQGRGRNWAATARWFLAGSMIGGVVLGVMMAIFTTILPAMSAGSRLGIAGVLALVGSASDAQLGGFRLPIHRRQVNEDWLDAYRPWVYAGGFGWQIGVGFATFITTAAVYLMVVLAVLTASPAAALALGVAFGLTRGLAVYLGRNLRTPEALRRFHRSFERTGPVSRKLVIGLQVVIGLVALGATVPAVIWVSIVTITIVSVLTRVLSQKRTVESLVN